jgi:hypothetical protein
MGVRVLSVAGWNLEGNGYGVIRFGLVGWRVEVSFGHLSGAPSLFSLDVHKLVVQVFICKKQHKQ